MAPAAVYLFTVFVAAACVKPASPAPHTIVCFPKPHVAMFCHPGSPELYTMFRVLYSKRTTDDRFSFSAALEHALEHRCFLGVQKLLEVRQNVRARGGQVAQKAAHMFLRDERLYA